ncbi:MAG: tripartite tricarboxylate transporter substrate-binding protein [Pseudomonadota bacterium]
MKLTRRQTMATGAGLLGSAMLPKLGFAQDYPERPITVAMLAPAGGATDRGTRPVLELMKGALGARAIAAQDMSGAGGIQGLDYVMGQPTDGYTWAGMNDIIEAFPSLGRIDYDWRAFDFWMSGGTACGICVPADSKIENFEQFMNELGDKPGEYSVSSTPSGTMWSNVAVYLREKGGLDFKLANYKGGGPSVRAVLAGETDFGCMGVTPMVNFINAGQLRCLVATVPEDWETAGTVIPSITNYIDDPLMTKTLPWTNIHGVALKKGAPEEVLTKIDAAFGEAMESSEILEVYAQNAFFPFQAPRQEANDLMGQRTALQAYVIEVILGMAEKTRDELDIVKLEDS